MPRNYKSLNVLVGTLVALAMVFGTLSVASAQHPAKKGVHLVIWDFFNQTPVNTPERVAMNKIAQQWAKKTGNTVTEPAQPANGSNNAFTADPHKAADIVMMPDDQAGADYGAKLVAPSKLQKSKYVASAVSGCTIKGHTFCYPWALEMVGLYYNKKLAPASLFKGKAYTWDKVAKWAHKFHAKTGKLGMVWQWDNFYYDYDFFTAYGGGALKHSSSGYTKKVLLDNRGSIRGLNYLKKVIDESGTPVSDWLSSNSNSGGYGAQLASGNAAIVLDGPWSDPTWRAAHLKYGFAPLPRDAQHKFGQPFLGVQTMVVNKFSKHVSAAQSLASYLSLHCELALFKAGARIPATKAALKKVSKNAELKQYSNGFKHSVPLPNVPFMSPIWSPAQKAIALTLQNNGSAAKNLKAAAAQARKAGA